eukprot:scaffold205916_cov36-Prasinocladus_malaysianus.AAC.1
MSAGSRLDRTVAEEEQDSAERSLTKLAAVLHVVALVISDVIMACFVAFKTVAKLSDLICVSK